MFRVHVSTLLALSGLALAVQTSPAADAPRQPDKGPRVAEVAEMLWAIAKGSGMGPGQGWFHDGQSRYGWKWLAERFDKDRDGAVTADEFRGPKELFLALDRTRDGRVTAEEFDWSDRSPLARQAMIPGQWLRMFDANSNGRISAAEWQQLFQRASKGKGYLTADDLRDAFPMSPPARQGNAARAAQVARAAGMPPAWHLALGILDGELGSFNEGPNIDDPAPDFQLKTFDGSQAISLAQFKGKKPVVLVFGSFT